MTARRALLAVLFAASAGVAACASTAKDPFVGAKSVDATVVERQYDPPGTGGASYAGTGNYYLVFEGKEGDATAHYRFGVTRQQYVRFQEGAHVQLVILDGNLRDIRPLQ
jgi:hypothetical protein